MAKLNSLFAPGWHKIIPGILVCAVFAFTTMNLDAFLKGYHQANVASEKIPALTEKLSTLKSRNATPTEIARIEKAIANNEKALAKVHGKPGDHYAWATLIYEDMHLTYVAFLLIGGILIRNLVGLHKALLPGVAVARPIIKPGIILLGVHYTLRSIIEVGATAIILTLVFILGTALLVMIIAKRLGVEDGLGGIMGAGTGVCGVSAIIATAPVVKSKPTDMAYAIGTILLFGTLMLLFFPYMGKAFGLSEGQFGAWAAIAILNTAQLIAAAEWYGPGARDMAVLINTARILFVPVIVLVTLWFYVLRDPKASKGAVQINKWRLMKDKFPVFILGWLALMVLQTFGLFGAFDDAGQLMTGTPAYAMDTAFTWFFAVGFAGIGLSISIADMRKAGGQAFKIGFTVAVAKTALGLLAVLLLGKEALEIHKG